MAQGFAVRYATAWAAMFVSDEAKLTVQATVPVTGDTAQPVLWAALLIVAILLLFLLRRRGKQQD